MDHPREEQFLEEIMANAGKNESEAVRTTIVGGRPPGSGRNNVPVPRGIEVLVKKASVDAEFRELFLTQRGKAATTIQLELDPAEDAMLSAIPQEQLAQIVDQTTVPMELRSAFLGRVAPVMLAALGVGLAASSPAQPSDAQSNQANAIPPASQVTNMIYTGNRPVAGAMAVPPLNVELTNQSPAQPPFNVAGLMKWMPPKPPTNPPPTNLPPPSIRGVQPDRPIAIFGLMMTPPAESPPTNAPPAEQPPAHTNAALPVHPPTNVLYSGMRPSLPIVTVAGAMAVPPPPSQPPATNAPDTKPQPYPPIAGITP
jgi:hypothetical protein